MIGSSGQSVLTPHSGPAHSITTLWWVMFGVACVGFTIVAVLLLLGWIRRNRAALPFGGTERAATRLVIGLGIATPLVLLTALFVWSDVFVIRTTAAPAPRSTGLKVHVIGHQWYWEIEYENGGGRIATANELHIPVNARVDVIGTSADVIHSFWVPELNRKIDLIPGRTTSVLLDANRAGTYIGQCAEFCGEQHSHMQISVVADRHFPKWFFAQFRPASHWLPLFAARGCANCHTIRGTPAQGDAGPDLTHVASRALLAAGMIPNDRAHMRAWLQHPQKIKPGAKMPDLPMSPRDLDALVSYLESLK